MKYVSGLFVILLTVLASCKKEKPSSAPVVGKWQEVKLRMYEEDSTAILYDTTYLKPFTSFDYIQFYSNGTCTISANHYYYLNIPGSPDNVQLINPQSSNWNYAAFGSKYVLNTQMTLTNPGGFITGDTVLVNSNTMLLHSVFYSHAPGIKTISDAYYSKQ